MMDLNENRDDAMEMESNEENTVENIHQMLDSKAEFDETWEMLDTITAYISADKKQNYINLKEMFANFIKHDEKRDVSINELKIAKTKLENLEQKTKDDKKEIENLRKKIKEQDAELSKAVEFRHDALGEEKNFYVYI